MIIILNFLYWKRQRRSSIAITLMINFQSGSGTWNVVFPSKDIFKTRNKCFYEIWWIQEVYLRIVFKTRILFPLFTEFKRNNSLLFPRDHLYTYDDSIGEQNSIYSLKFAKYKKWNMAFVPYVQWLSILKSIN